jgi:hypothetical protein
VAGLTRNDNDLLLRGALVRVHFLLREATVAFCVCLRVSQCKRYNDETH